MTNPLRTPHSTLRTSSGSPRTGSRNVLVASRSFGKNCPEVLERMKAEGCVFLPGFGKTPGEMDLAARMVEVDVLVSGTEPVTARVLAPSPRLKLIAKHGVGVDNIDLAAAKGRGIPVAVAGPAMVDSVADLALGLLLALARRILQGNASVKAGRWDRFIGSELRGKVLGIVGLGQIGKAVAGRAKSFGLELIAFDAFPDRTLAESLRDHCRKHLAGIERREATLSGTVKRIRPHAKEENLSTIEHRFSQQMLGVRASVLECGEERSDSPLWLRPDSRCAANRQNRGPIQSGDCASLGHRSPKRGGISDGSWIASFRIAQALGP